MKWLFVFFLLPLQSFAQDITGVWTGTLYNDTTKQYLKYELAISEYEGKLSGYSHTIFIIDSTENIGVKSVKIKRSNDDFLVEDDKLIDNNYTAPPAKGVKTFSDLVLSQNDSVLVLSGSFETNQTRIYKKLTGKIFLQKKREAETSSIIPKLQKLGLARTLSFPTSPSTANMTVSQSPDLIPVKANDQIARTEKEVVAYSSVTTKNSEEESAKQYPKEKIEKDNAIKKTAPKEIASQEEKHENITAAEVAIPETAISGKNDIRTNNKIIDSSEAPKQTIALKNEPKTNGTSYSTSQPTSIRTVAAMNTDPSLGNENSLKLNIIKPVIPQAAADVAIRKIEMIKSVEIKQDSLVLSLFDNGEIDGDTVSVLLNGKVIMPRQGLMSRAINKTIYLTPEMGDSITLIMYAENLGSIPPNTGLLVIHDGEDIFEIRFAGDLQKSSAIILKRKKKQ